MEGRFSTEIISLTPAASYKEHLQFTRNTTQFFIAIFHLILTIAPGVMAVLTIFYASGNIDSKMSMKEIVIWVKQTVRQNPGLP